MIFNSLISESRKTFYSRAESVACVFVLFLSHFTSSIHCLIATNQLLYFFFVLI